MRVYSITAAILLFMANLAQAGGPTTQPAPTLTAGKSFTITFPEMPATYAELNAPKGAKPMMTVFLPQNYDARKKLPLLIWLTGGNGGTGNYPGVARKLTEEKDFICVSIPLFKEKLEAPTPENASQRLLIRNPDCRYGWPFYRQMLDRIDQVVPNIDPDRRILGGFSNGAHATSGLIDESDGEIARRFTAFIFGEGGGKLQHYELLKGKPFLMIYGSNKSKPRAEQIAQAAKEAGAQVTLLGMNNVGHAFPESEYPGVRNWLREVCGIAP
jgi:predicted peptidase